MRRTPRDRPQLRPGPRAAKACVVVAACGLAASACGSSGSHAASPTNPTNPTASSSSAASSSVAPATASVPTAPSTTAAAAANSGPCITGDWATTSYTQQVPGASLSGGAGIRVTITASTISLDFSAMQPVAFRQGAINGTGKFDGQEAAGFSPHPTGATTGTFTLTPQSSTVTFQSTINGHTTPPIKANSFPPGGGSGTWACPSPTMATLTVPSPNGPTTLSLQRSS